MKNSKIEWTDHTFNPWHGCAKVSPGCANCYAETLSNRLGRKIWGPAAPRKFFGDKHWNEPLKWNREAARAGEQRRVFCSSMADIFEIHPNPEIADRQVFARVKLATLIAATTNLRWLLLTKRPENWSPQLGWVFDGERFYEPTGRIWVGVTAENQEQADRRIPELLKIPAAVRFISYEPALGPVDLTEWLDRLDWVIAGGESGPKARPAHPAWFRSVRDQCAAAGVPFLFKQWGNYSPIGEPDQSVLSVCADDGWSGFPDRDSMLKHANAAHGCQSSCPPFQIMYNVGKKAAGRLLDGREHNEFPEAV